MIKCDLLELLSDWSFHNEIVCIIWSNIFSTANKEKDVKNKM